jgi:flagellar basal body-associated protein FliL
VALWKEKLQLGFAGLKEKLAKLPLPARWKAQSKESPVINQGPAPFSIGAIYRSGSTGTRIQVILMFCFALSALFFTGMALRGALSRLSHHSEFEQMSEKVSHDLSAIRDEKAESASIMSLGTFTVNSVLGDGSPGLVRADLWLKLDSPNAAAWADKNLQILYDGTVEAFNEARLRKASPLDSNGKILVRNLIIEKLNPLFPEGKVVDVFFHNLVAD